MNLAQNRPFKETPHGGETEDSGIKVPVNPGIAVIPDSLCQAIILITVLL